MAKTIFEEMGGKYERQGDYLIPCLTVPAEEEQPIGIWGQRHLDYLKHHCKVTYTNLLTSGRLNAYLADIDRQAQERFERPEKYEAHVAQGGTNLSGGQKQRLAIARAIARNPEIYIFDDSFSALDYKTDYTLREELRNYTKDSTNIIVAQRIGTILNADKIIVLENGECVGMGTHKELLSNCKVYQEIAYSQLSKEELENG